MKDKIIQALEEYEKEPQHLIRVIPDKEILADWIIAILKD